MASSSVQTAAPPVQGGPATNRWVRLVGGVLAVMAVATVLLASVLLRSAPDRVAMTLAAAENAFAAFIFVETLFVPLEAWLGDHLPRSVLVGAGCLLLVAGALAGTSAGSARGQVFWYAVGGAGGGLVYGGTVAKVLKSFTDRKALCVGVTAVACAGVIGLAVAAVAALSAQGALPVLLVLGAGQGVVILIATVFIVAPPPARPPPDW